MQSMFRVIVVGLGVQGHKRRQFAGQDFIAAVDPIRGRDVTYGDSLRVHA